METSLRKELHKRLARAIVSVASTFVLLCTSLVYFAGTSFGWFSNNTNVSSSGMGVSVAITDIGSAGMSVYPVSSIVNNTYVFDASVSGAEIPCYDPSNIMTSRYEKALVFDLTFVSPSEREVELTATASGSWSLAASNYISNCVRLSLATVTAENTLTVSKYGSFVTLQNGAPNKTNTQTFAVNVPKGAVHLYLVMDYNASVLEYIADNGMGELISYVNDISFHLGNGGAN